MSDELPDFAQYLGFDRAVLVDTSETRRAYLITTANGSHIRLSESAYHLIQWIRSGIEIEQLCEVMNSQPDSRAVTPEQLRKEYRKVLVRLDQIRLRPGRQLPKGYWFSIRILPEGLVGKVASKLSLLYESSAAILLLCFLLAAVNDAVFQGLSFHIGDGILLPAYALFLLSLVAHEFGHASACARYGARPSEIGFTLYLVYPAFYSDVTAAWQLGRYQRFVVDIGGCFFQCIIGAVFLFLFRITGWQPLRVAVLAILFSCIVSLNPIFKFDGYWALADLLGVTNLGQQPLRIGRCLVNKLLARKTSPLPWPTWITCILFVYSTISTYVWGVFLWMVLPEFWLRLTTFRHLCGRLATVLASGHVPRASEFGSILVSLMFLVIAGLIASRTVKRLLSPLVRRLRRTLLATRAQVSTVDEKSRN